ncbi:uncharacterized protein LOC135103737 [Scylla paramamosain]|uniref:uncharacterized protein LOC135103737 n=1 Tax=Scylla paramamosain TaxID=85552 RepID=UPI003083242A
MAYLRRYLLLLLLPAYSCARFYIGRYKTVASSDSVSQARSLPYIVYPGEAGSEALAFDQHTQRQWRVERPPNRLGHLEPAGAFGLTNNYGNDPYDGYTLVHKDEVKYVVPPFTPGGRVHVAFQFWIPISIGGFSVTGRDLENALRSSNPTAYITSLFLKHLSANTTAGELLGEVEAPVVEAAIERFLDWVVPHLHHFIGSNTNALNTLTPTSDKKRHKTRKNKRSLVQKAGRKRRAISSFFSQEQDEENRIIKRDLNYNHDYLTPTADYSNEKKTRHSTSNLSPDDGNIHREHKIEKKSLDAAADFTEVKKESHVQDARSHLAPRLGDHRNKRQVRDFSDGWVTIGGGKERDTTNPAAPLMTRLPVWPPSRPGRVQNDRLLWDGDQPVITHNNLSMEQDKQPSVDFTSPIDHPSSRPSPTSSSLNWSSFTTRPPHRPLPSHPSQTPTSQPTDYRPSSSSYPSSSSSSSRPIELKPPFLLSSFDDLPSLAPLDSKALDVRNRLSRLDYLFTNLHLEHEDCRRRVLCEVALDRDTFDPLSSMIHDETRLPGNPVEVSRELLNTAEGSRLLSYVEAVKVGEDRANACDLYRYRCRVQARQVINTDILPIWREVVRWLTVKVLTQNSSRQSENLGVY